MRYLLILMTAILALAGFVIGGAHVLGGLLGYAEFAGNGNLGGVAQSTGYAYADNGSRFLGGLFFSMGLGFAYCLINLPNKLLLFRFLLLSLFIGGIGRITGWVALGVTETTIGAVVIELVFPPIMLILQRNTSRADNASL